AKIDKIMLPGDYLAMKMTGEIVTTDSGLSEGILWDFKNAALADIVMADLGISPDLIARTVPTFSVQGELSKSAAEELGLRPGTKISYRAGDQPNNALSLNVLNPGEIAATAGTSGVVYGIGEKPNYDPKSRVNTFIHVNDTKTDPRYGVLLCINGTGILNSWLKHNVVDSGWDYPQMNELAGTAPVGSDGLTILPYGNGAERTLENADIGAQINGMNFNLHSKAHLLRAAQEGIVFALNYGLDIMREMDVQAQTVRAGAANMFLSPLFANAFATVTGAVVQLYNTDGSQGAARGAGIGAGIYKNTKEAFTGLKITKTIEPDPATKNQYEQAYQNWLGALKKQLNS
ncbi:MAG: carbohydrate kinase, partial [Planctomycetes bacterium]|nr:carbohydrate kinase [Planctomycetota bacterium]